jgi:hypothetical protein
VTAWTLALPKSSNGSAHSRVMVMREGPDVIKHFESKGIPNLCLSKEKATHPLDRSWPSRPKSIKVCSPNIDLKEGIGSILGLGLPLLKSEESTPIVFKGR